MYLVINDNCINCKACKEECTIDAVYFDSHKDHFKIDNSKCNVCFELSSKPLCVEICPMNCITYSYENNYNELNNYEY